jgi:hypothetical protein
VETGDGVVLVVLAGQEVRQLDPIEVSLQGLELRGELAGELWIVLVRQQLVEDLDVLELLQEA